MNTSIPTRRLGGYTLMELLVVIVIIGLLTAMATAGYNRAQITARNNARKTNVISLSHAVEAYYSVNKKFPGKTAVQSGESVPAGNYMSCEMVDGKSNYVYRYTQINDGATPCNSLDDKTISTDKYYYSKIDWQPYPVWIPGLGNYINPFPTESKFTSDGDPLTGDFQTYAYRHLPGGYMVYTQLESVSAKDESDKNQFNGANALDTTSITTLCSKPEKDWPQATLGAASKVLYVICQ